MSYVIEIWSRQVRIQLTERLGQFPMMNSFCPDKIIFLNHLQLLSEAGHSWTVSANSLFLRLLSPNQQIPMLAQ